MTEQSQVGSSSSRAVAERVRSDRMDSTDGIQDMAAAEAVDLLLTLELQWERLLRFEETLMAQDWDMLRRHLMDRETRRELMQKQIEHDQSRFTFAHLGRGTMGIHKDQDACTRRTFDCRRSHPLVVAERLRRLPK